MGPAGPAQDPLSYKHWDLLDPLRTRSYKYWDPLDPLRTCSYKCWDPANLAKLTANILPGILDTMKKKHKWSSVPRVVVHDKASYMVSATSQRLNVTFAEALKAGGLRSWVGDIRDSAIWLTGKMGDVYPHETLISHIRRLLDRQFPCRRLKETAPQFMARMAKTSNNKKEQC